MPATKSKIKNQKTKSVKTVSPNSVRAESKITAAKRKNAEVKTPLLTANVFDITGKSAGTIKLPEKTFGAKVNKALISQALRVYFTNTHTHTAHSKTRAEVRGGGRKPWKQKGTGNARAGSKRSPLWVGGGITFGPRTRDVKMELPKKMKKAALISVLSEKAQKGTISIITNFEKISPKTKSMAGLLQKTQSIKPTLIIVGEKNSNLYLASRNIPQTTLETPENLNAYMVWQNNNILISKEALSKFT